MAPRNKDNKKKGSRGRRKSEDSGSGNASCGEPDEDYRRRRDRNNQAVKRSRVKSKLKAQQTIERVQQLKLENGILEERIKFLTKELGILKDLFLAHAGSAHGIKLENIDLEELLSDEPLSESAFERLERLRVKSLQEGERLNLGREDTSHN